jgi:glycerate 2-kinase
MTQATRARLRAEAGRIFRAAIAAVDPTRLVIDHLSVHGRTVRVDAGGQCVEQWDAPTLVIGAGKAAARMASGCEQVLGSERTRGEVIVADGCGSELASIRVSEAGHPLPDTRGEAAARRLVACMRQPGAGGILCLISGGASSLLVSPRPPLTLRDKIRTTQLLLECGADINELNMVRKHLSAVKGGGLLRFARAPMAALLISDVPGDDPNTIGSGPTAPDPTTFAQAWAVMERYDLQERAPPATIALLRSGRDGQIPETVKPQEPDAGRCRNVIVGTNRTALRGAAREAHSAGWAVDIDTQVLAGDTTEVARQFGSRLRHWVRGAGDRHPRCLLAGGETTVRVQGTGRGGRNQEFALALAAEIKGDELVVLSAGTDGIDGPTDAAGAFVDGGTLQRAAQRQLDHTAALANNDSYPFFAQLDDLFRCGPTATNVMDIKIALCPARSGSV